MNIVFITKVTRNFNGQTLFNEPLGGTHSALIQLANQLSLNGHNVTIFCNCKDNEGFFNGVQYLLVNKLIKFSKNTEIDIFISVASESIFKLNIKAKKKILWIHNDYNPYWNFELSDIASEISEFMAVKVDRIVSVSNWQKDIIKNVFNIPDNHFITIYNGINPDLFTNRISKDTKRLIYSGVPDRGLDLLLDIFSILQNKFQDLELQVFSSFDIWKINDLELKEIENKIYDKAKKIKNVFLNKPLPIPDLAKELSKSYLWIYPNCPSYESYAPYETFCVAALEAQAAGLPVITSARGGLKENIIDNKTGYLIDKDPYSDEYKEEFIFKTISLLEDKKLWQGFSNNAKQRGMELSWYNLAKEWENLFYDLLNENNITKLEKRTLEPLFPKPDVSVIIPTYNRGKNLNFVLNSLTNQTFKNFEVIISDDGSIDNTKEIVETYRKKLNIRYIYLGENKGFRAARTRNLGLRKARGELIIFLDSDIIVPQKYIETHMAAHKKYDKILVNCCVYRMKSYKEEDLGLEPDEYIHKHIKNLDLDIKEKYNLFDRNEPIEQGYYLDSNSFSIKSKYILEDGFDSDFVGWGYEDTELGYRYEYKGFKFLFLKENCTGYHIFHGINELRNEKENSPNWKRLTKKYNIKNWYYPKHLIEVIGEIQINSYEVENNKLITAKFNIGVGNSFVGFVPYKTIMLDNGGKILDIY